MDDKRLLLRKASEDDINILFDWVNDKETRKNAFDTHSITYEEHSAWFKRMMADASQIQYILMLGETPIGQIRLTIDAQVAEIDYSISNTARGYGYGKEIIMLVTQRVREDCPTVKKLIGRVKTNNIASYRCFTENSFKEVYKQLELEINS